MYSLVCILGRPLSRPRLLVPVPATPGYLRNNLLRISIPASCGNFAETKSLAIFIPD